MLSHASTELTASLYCFDENNDKTYQGNGLPLKPGERHELCYRIPAIRGALLSEVGLVLHNRGDEPWNGSIKLDYLGWQGSPDYSYDFSKERNESQACSQWTYLRGYWRLENGDYVGSGAGISESYSGDIGWQDYSVTVQVTPLLGRYHNINIRVQGALRSYALGLAPDRLILYKKQSEYGEVAGTPFSWELGKTYILNLSARGNLLKGRCCQSATLEWQDEEPYLHGQIGLSNFGGCSTIFKEVQIHGPAIGTSE